MLAWNPEEAAKVVENYKIYENKPPDRIMEKIENDPHQKVFINFLKKLCYPKYKTANHKYIEKLGTLKCDV